MLPEAVISPESRARECGKAHRVAAEVETERGLVSRHRLDILHHDVFRPLARRLDRKLRIAAGIYAGIRAHHGFKRLALRGYKVLTVVDDLDAGVAAVQIEACNIVAEFFPADKVRCDKQSPDTEQHVGVRLHARRHGVACVGDGVVEILPGCMLYLD